MTLGRVKAIGTATIAAGDPGERGSIDVSLSSLASSDRVIVTISDTATQDSSDINDDDFTFEVVKTAGTGFTIYSYLRQNKSVEVDYVVLTPEVQTTKEADEDIDGDYITHLELDGSSATVALTNLVVSEVGQEVFLYCSDASNAVTVATKTGTTFDGTNTLATFTAGEYIKLRAVSATQFVVLENTSDLSAP